MIDNVFVALDFPSYNEFKNSYEKIKNDFKCFKVGYELFYAEGYKVINTLKSDNKVVFLDLKFHDIGNTMIKALFSLVKKIKFDYLTVFLENNEHDLRELSYIAHDNNIKLLGVTLLTNISDVDVNNLYDNITIKDIIQKRVNIAKLVNFDGLILSPLDLKDLNIPKKLLKVTPGIRYKDEKNDDQRRRVSPKEAFELGSDYLVMGRSIFKYGVNRLKEELKI